MSRYPEIGQLICDCRYRHLRITAIADDRDTITLEDGSTCSYSACADLAPHDDFWQHPPDVPVEEVPREEGAAFFDQQCRDLLGIPGREFLDQLDAGTAWALPADHDVIFKLVMLAPFAR